MFVAEKVLLLLVISLTDYTKAEIYYLCRRTKVVFSSLWGCLFACLITNYGKNAWTDFHTIDTTQQNNWLDCPMPD